LAPAAAIHAGRRFDECIQTAPLRAAIVTAISGSAEPVGKITKPLCLVIGMRFDARAGSSILPNLETIACLKLARTEGPRPRNQIEGAAAEAAAWTDDTQATPESALPL
jgi:hypothetical protein